MSITRTLIDTAFDAIEHVDDLRQRLRALVGVAGTVTTTNDNRQFDTIEQLARRLGVSRRNVWDWEIGR
jgi:hypothetical protein